MLRVMAGTMVGLLPVQGRMGTGAALRHTRFTSLISATFHQVARLARIHTRASRARHALPALPALPWPSEPHADVHTP